MIRGGTTLLSPVSRRSDPFRQDELLGRIKTILESGTAAKPASPED